jgi:flagellar biosynthesis chaperone FliJ
MSTYALYTLRDLRVTGERQAEQALAQAVAAVRRAEAERDRLAAKVTEARAAVAGARATPSPALTVADALTVRRFWARLEAEAQAASDVLERHRTTTLAAALQAEVAARASHLRARQRREVVDKAIARREAQQRQERQRREEAAADDLAQRRKT